MNGKVLGKVFYTPVQNPDAVRYIKIRNNDELELVNGFVRRIVTKKIKNPYTDAEKPQFREKILEDLMEGKLKITSKKVKELFERLSNYMYGRAREEKNIGA